VNLGEYADVVGRELIVMRYPGQDGRWCCHFSGAEIKEGAILTSAHGNGKTPHAAMTDYVSKIRGRTLVFDAWDNAARMVTGCPNSLVAE
jgi:hypothetical protein